MAIRGVEAKLGGSLPSPTPMQVFSGGYARVYLRGPRL
jgi:hypothetical protein